MGVIEDEFRRWLGTEYPDGKTRWHQDDLEAAFAAGWLARGASDDDEPEPPRD